MRQRDLLPPSASITAHMALNDFGVCHDARARLRDTNKLQRVLNSAARVVSGTRKFDRGLRQLIHTELHWLNVP